ncbi:MAG: penicillin-binding protein 2 [Oscillospiraceae bacterium]|nr:penicillin-binding protein 2 [Oscillospiraceae bacterium]
MKRKDTGPAPLPPYEGPLTRRIHRRILICFGLFCLGFSCLYLRIGLLSRSDELAETAARQSRYTLTAVSDRGMIYDRHLQPLVGEKTTPVSVILPQPRNTAAVLEAVPDSRKESVSQLLQRGTPFLLQDIAFPQGLFGVYAFSARRRYSESQLAPHLIGYLNSEGQGITGIEKSFDSLLQSQSHQIQVVCSLDGLQRTIAGAEPQIRETGSETDGIVLTLNRQIQAIVEQAGQELLKKGAIVVMDPYSGEIVASASFPSFSPLHLEEAVTDTENSPMINRALLPYSVGSTFKVVTAAAALEAGIPLTETAECKGWINVSGQIFRCHLRSGHGELDMLDAMKESCNPYFIRLGLTVGGSVLLEMTERFGFGQQVTLAEGLSVSAGTLPDEASLASPAAVANLSFGQGELTASPVQIARMMSAVVNGGWLITPRLVLGETDGTVIQRQAASLKKRILEPEIAAQLQTFLIHCVMVSEGQNALPQSVTAGGKTATAQTGRWDKDGNELEHGWFAGFFPAVNPSYAVVVLSEDSGFGNATAAPVFARIADEVMALG